MVKSANLQAKSKDIDVNRLRQKLTRIEKGQSDNGSNYGGGGGGNKRGGDRSNSSRQSRLGHGISPAQQQNGFGLDNVIPERDAELEQTGVYQYEREPIHNRQNGNFPPMTKTKQQEWEEAVELDRMLEQERNIQSKANLAKKQESNFNAYMEQLKDRSLKNQSSGLSGVLGSSSPYYSGAGAPTSLPDLKQSKRESK